MAGGRPWLQHELAWLRQWCSVLLVEDLAQILRRGVPAVRTRIQELGLGRRRAYWNEELDEILALLYPDTVAREVAQLLGVTTGAVHQRALTLGVRKDPAFAAESSRRSTLARSPFQPELAEVIELLYPDTLTEHIAAFVGIPKGRIHAYAKKRGWKKTPEFVRLTARARTGPDHPMRRYQFPKGNVPANKGRRGVSYPGMEATQFKKGQMPHTWMPIGSYRINSDGVLDQKVSDTGYPPRDWVGKHRLVWIEAKGEIPPGHVVRFKDGMRTTAPELLTVDRLECITKAENARRNAWHRNMPPQLRKLVGTRMALTRVINRRQREQAEAT